MSEPDEPDESPAEVPFTGDLSSLRPAAAPPPTGLDPDAALQERAAYERPMRPLPPVIDTRKYQRMIGGFGLLLVVIFSVYLYAKGGNGTPGVAPGQHLHNFVAPLATSDLTDVDANAHPICNPRRPSGRGLNVCGRQPIVLTFFVSGHQACIQQVDTLQSIAARFPQVTFAAVGLGLSHDATEKLVRENHWTIPIAYDKADVVGQIYGVEVCPLVEIAKTGGVVDQRLIGSDWLSTQRLAGAVAKLER